MCPRRKGINVTSFDVGLHFIQPILVRYASVNKRPTRYNIPQSQRKIFLLQIMPGLFRLRDTGNTDVIVITYCRVLVLYTLERIYV